MLRLLLVALASAPAANAQDAALVVDADPIFVSKSFADPFRGRFRPVQAVARGEVNFQECGSGDWRSVEPDAVERDLTSTVCEDPAPTGTMAAGGEMLDLSTLPAVRLASAELGGAGLADCYAGAGAQAPAGGRIDALIADPDGGFDYRFVPEGPDRAAIRLDGDLVGLGVDPGTDAGALYAVVPAGGCGPFPMRAPAEADLRGIDASIRLAPGYAPLR